MNAPGHGSASMFADDLADMGRLYTLTMRLASVVNLPSMLDEILCAILELQGADIGNIQLYDPATRTLSIAVQKGFHPACLDHFANTRVGDGSVSGKALEKRARVVVEDIGMEPDFAPHRAVAAEVGFRAAQSTPIFAADGTMKGMLSTHFRNPHRPSERDLRLTDLYMWLATRLVERAQAEATAEAARRAADEASQAKSRLLAAASHDLGHWLQSIVLLHAILQQQVTDPDACVTLARLNEPIRQMTELIDSLLDVTRIESKAAQLELTDVSVSLLFTRVVRLFAPLASAKRLKLRCVPASVVIRGDLQLLVRILGNLLSNAIKFTDRGKILVGCRRRSNGLRIEVWDTGIGIPTDHLNSLFEEFYRVDPADNGQVGFGLGLHVVKRFADLLGYQVEARSMPGKGSMFALLIPSLYTAPTSRREDADQGEIPPSVPTILLVSDEPTQLEALSALLQLQGYGVTEARNGPEALVRLQEYPHIRPNVIIINLIINGGMSSSNFIEQVRGELNAELPALIIGEERQETLLAISKKDDLQFLSKPVKPADLLATVEMLSKRTVPDWRAQNVEYPMVAPPSVPDALSEIAVIDDEPAVRDAVVTTLKGRGYKVESFATGEAFLSDSGRGRFRCLLVEAFLPGMSGLELQSHLMSEQRPPAIIFLTGSGSVSLAVEAMREGAADFLQKPVDGAALLASVTRVIETAMSTIPAQYARGDVTARLATLSKREREIMDRVVAGELNKNIAADLGISERTAEHHRQSMMRKMGVRSLAVLVRTIATEHAAGLPRVAAGNSINSGRGVGGVIAGMDLFYEVAAKLRPSDVTSSKEPSLKPQTPARVKNDKR